MRSVEWVEEGAMGAPDALARGSMAELLVGGPYPSLTPPEVPPRCVVNEVLSSRGGSGMNGGRRWAPLTIDEAEYRDLVSELVQVHGFVVDETPDWVTTREDWHVWLIRQCH